MVVHRMCMVEGIPGCDVWQRRRAGEESESIKSYRWCLVCLSANLILRLSFTCTQLLLQVWWPLNPHWCKGENVITYNNYVRKNRKALGRGWDGSIHRQCWNILSFLNSFNTLWTTLILYLSVPMFGTDLTAQFDVHMQPAPTVVLKCLQSVESNG